MKHFIRKILGGDGDSTQKLEANSNEAHELRNQITFDSLRRQHKVDILNRATSQKLQTISNQVADVAVFIAMAQGKDVHIK